MWRPLQRTRYPPPDETSIDDRATRITDLKVGPPGRHDVHARSHRPVVGRGDGPRPHPGTAVAQAHGSTRSARIRQPVHVRELVLGGIESGAVATSAVVAEIRGELDGSERISLLIASRIRLLDARFGSRSNAASSQEVFPGP